MNGVAIAAAQTQANTQDPRRGGVCGATPEWLDTQDGSPAMELQVTLYDAVVTIDVPKDDVRVDSMRVVGMSTLIVALKLTD